MGRLATVTVTERNNVVLPAAEQTRYEYDLLGRLDLQREAHGVIADYVYDSLNRLTGLTHYAPDATPLDLSDNPMLDQHDAVLRADGKRDLATERQWIDGVEKVTVIDWVYDQVGRLTSGVEKGISPIMVDIGLIPFSVIAIDGCRLADARERGDS